MGFYVGVDYKVIHYYFLFFCPAYFLFLLIFIVKTELESQWLAAWQCDCSTNNDWVKQGLTGCARNLWKDHPDRWAKEWTEWSLRLGSSNFQIQLHWVSMCADTLKSGKSTWTCICLCSLIITIALVYNYFNFIQWDVI